MSYVPFSSTMVSTFLEERGHTEKNPVSTVKRPKYSVKRGKTPDFSSDEFRRLLAAIDASTLIGQRDRPLFATMVYTFARVSAVVQLGVEDYFARGRRMWLRLNEKRGKVLEVPVHHLLEQYLEAAGPANEQRGPLFRSVKINRFSDRAIGRVKVWERVRHYCRIAGIEEKFGCHSHRATGITAHLKNGGSLDQAQKIAAHSSVATTKLYDRRDDTVTVEEIERIRL